MSRFIQIVEVGPRDGLQNEKTVLDPAVRADLVRRLEAAGARRIEAVSFVHPKYVPQMAGAEEVMAALPPEAGRSRIGLVLNGKGYDRALATGVDEVNVSVAATDGFGLKNQGLSVKDQLAMLGEIVARRHNGGVEGAPSLSAMISCVWGCPFDGEVSVDQVADMVGAIADLGVARDRPGRHHRRRRSLGRDPQGRGRRARPRRTRPCACISTTPATPAWPTPMPASRPGSTCWTPRSAASAAVRSRPAPRAISPPRTWSICWRAAGSKPAMTWTP
jgi:hypothetical protein